MIHALIVGTVGVGKSTLIRRVLKELDHPAVGFETVKLKTPVENGYPVHLFELGQPQIPTKDNRIGICGMGHAEAYKEAFDRYAPRLLCSGSPGNVLKMDELGFLENSSPAFCKAVLSRLDGSIPVLAAVKPKETPFLNAVRTHPNCRCFHITVENRDTLWLEVLSFLQDSFR